MVSDILSDILSAEEEAEEMLQNAVLDSGRIIDDAKKVADEILASAKLKGNDETKKILAENENRAADLIKEGECATKEEITAIRAKTADKKEEAILAIMKKLSS